MEGAYQNRALEAGGSKELRSGYAVLQPVATMAACCSQNPISMLCTMQEQGNTDSACASDLVTRIKGLKILL